MLAIPRGGIENGPIRFGGERDHRAGVRQMQHSQADAQSPVVHTLQWYAVAIAPSIEQADEPVIIAVGKAAGQGDISRAVVDGPASLPLRSGRRNRVILLGANNSVGAKMNEIIVVFGHPILHVPQIGDPEGARAGLLK